MDALGRDFRRGGKGPRQRRRVVAALATLAKDPALERQAYLTLAGSLCVEKDSSVVEMAVATLVELGPFTGGRPREDYAGGMAPVDGEVGDGGGVGTDLDRSDLGIRGSNRPIQSSTIGSQGV